jgi:GNAT superfamily N-acetyltransferase
VSETEPVAVRPAVPTDAPAIAGVHVASWHSAYAELMPAAYLNAMSVGTETERWSRALARDPGRGRATFVAEDRAGRVLGYATVGPDVQDASRGLLFLMYVLPEVWGRGAGGRLMAASEGALLDLGHRDAVLWVLEENARARRFYEHWGWRADGERSTDDYGGVSLPALRYVRALGDRSKRGDNP